jgi:hypothetical protein
VALAFGLVGCKASTPTSAVPDGPRAAVATSTPDAASAAPDPRGARAANLAGMKRYRAKDYAGAATQFRAAIAADPAHVLAHYNLACVAALQGDRAAALAQLDWLGHSADPRAKAALAKAGKDADLRLLAADPAFKALVAAAYDEWGPVIGGYHPLVEGRKASPREEQLLTKALGPCDGACERPAMALEADLVADRPGPETVVAEEERGVAIFDQAGELVASRKEPFGDVRNDSVISVGQVVPDAEPEIVLLETTGRPASFTQQIVVLKRRGTELATILDEQVRGFDARPSDDDPDDEQIRDDYTKLVLGAEGQVRTHDGRTLAWDPGPFRLGLQPRKDK